MEKEYLRRKEAADYLQSKYGSGSTGTLAKLVTVGGGPLYTKFGKTVCYTKRDLDEWMRARMTRHASSSVALDDAPAETADQNGEAAA